MFFRLSFPSSTPFYTGALLHLHLLFAFPATSPAQTVPDHFTVSTVHSSPGFQATAFALLPDGRILVTEHQSGKINLIVHPENPVTTIATIPNLTISNEQGLLGIAVDPDFPSESYVYVYYTSDSGVNRVSRFIVQGDLENALSDSLLFDMEAEEVLIEFIDESRFHNAGTLRFGSDKTLYISHGDDVKFKFWEDDELYLQDLNNPYGKILRINRDGTVPDDNPAFPDEPPDRLPEIFATGLRNPFRFSIDPETDRLFIGDVGSNLREEFNLSSGGENFGYPRYEGIGFFYENANLTHPDPTPPVYDYPWEGQNAAIALVTYRPIGIASVHQFPAEFDGAHFFVDYFDDELMYLRPDVEGGWESASFGTGFIRLVDGALGSDGSMYLLRYGGPLRRISYTRPSVGIDDPHVAGALHLEQNYPNPFDERTWIRYETPADGHVRLEIFDLLGRRVATSVDRWQHAGLHSVTVDADGLAAGRYVYRLQAGGSPALSRTLVRVHR